MSCNLVCTNIFCSCLVSRSGSLTDNPIPTQTSTSCIGSSSIFFPPSVVSCANGINTAKNANIKNADNEIKGSSTHTVGGYYKFSASNIIASKSSTIKFSVDES